jgi:hypothetical protein
MDGGAAEGVTLELVDETVGTISVRQALRRCPVDIGGGLKIAPAPPRQMLKVGLFPLERNKNKG